MNDPVADVLAERSAAGNGLPAAIALSLILHGAGAGIAIISALREPPPRPASRINIRFTQAPRTVPVRSSPVTPAKAPPKAAQPRIEEPAPQPKAPPKKAVEPPAKNTVPLSPFGRSTKKGAENPAPPPPSPPPASREATSTAGQIGIGETGISGLEGGDFPYTLYLDRMKSLVGARWIRPQMSGEPRAVVYFRVERDGTIRDPQIMSGSGNSAFDRAALRAVMEASPLPPLPYGYSGYYLGVHLTFR